MNNKKNKDVGSQKRRSHTEGFLRLEEILVIWDQIRQPLAALKGENTANECHIKGFGGIFTNRRP